MSAFRWGIFGTGTISAKFVAGLVATAQTEVSFVASRSAARAQRFAARMRVPRAIEGYANAAQEGGVDAIYIATPPALHVEHALTCIHAGIPVLVEKPLATTVDDATRLIVGARDNAVFAMEAMWTRFLPAVRLLRDQLDGHCVGDVRMLAASLGVAKSVRAENTSFNPVLGGGAISQLGVYPLSLGQYLFGPATLMHALGNVGETQVDEDVAFHLRYQQNVLATCYVSIRSWAPSEFRVLGTTGEVCLRGPLIRPSGITLSRRSVEQLVERDYSWRMRLRQRGWLNWLAQRVGRTALKTSATTIGRFYAGNGYHYQAEEVRRCLQQGSLESSCMPLSDSLEIVQLSEQIRHHLRTV